MALVLQCPLFLGYQRTTAVQISLSIAVGIVTELFNRRGRRASTIRSQTPQSSINISTRIGTEIERKGILPQRIYSMSMRVGLKLRPNKMQHTDIQ